MSHLDSSFRSFETFLQGAEAFWSVDLSALNSSGVNGTAVLALATDDDGDTYLNVSVSASGLTPNQVHLQHIHGLFDDDGNPTDSVTPGLANDTDGDGIVEVLEGVTSYGDIILSLNDPETGAPTADRNGDLSFIQAYDLSDPANFVSPVTGNQYSAEDLLPLMLREIVLHGVDVPAGLGAGTTGEVDGTQDGYVPILPAAAGEITEISRREARDILEDQAGDAAGSFVLGNRDNTFDGGTGDDRIIGRGGDDVLLGGGDNDVLKGNGGADMLFGGSGADRLFGNAGQDRLVGGDGTDALRGQGGDDILQGYTGRDFLIGGTGNDTLRGGGAADRLFGGTDADALYGGAGGDTLIGGDGRDVLWGQGGDDLLVGGDGVDTIDGGAGDDIIGGLGGNDFVTGGDGRDEFHFDAGTGADMITDFVQGEDVISFLDDGAISFARSTTDGTRGDSDLAAADFDTVAGYAALDAGNDQQVVYSSGTNADLAAGSGGAAVEAYIAVSDGADTFVYYDADWSDTAGRELVATLDGFNSTMTVSDFDVY